tara:strand:+ start:44062 stop:44337 length:276 start_codon:yes stop_codon:yes gene_type:complete
MKAQGIFSFSDSQGKTRKVKTIVNDDFSIHSFYFDPSDPTYKKMIKPKEQYKLGDWVKKTIDFFTYKKVKPCGACKKRQAMLNNLTQKEKN